MPSGVDPLPFERIVSFGTQSAVVWQLIGPGRAFSTLQLRVVLALLTAGILALPIHRFRTGGDTHQP